MMVTRPASIVLCDIKMPGQDGLWLAARLRAHWPRTQIVMVTAADDLETVRQSRELGAVDFITKPISSELLLQVIRRRKNDGDEAAVTPEPVVSVAEEPALEEADDIEAESNSIEAEYTLECPVRCPICGERIASLKAVRLVRRQVNFTSTLPRRGRVMACPHCLALVPAELTNF
jgi:DNA-binding response OmpR family regulator